MQQLNLEQDSKVVRISGNNYKKIVERAKFGMSFDDALTDRLKELEKT